MVVESVSHNGAAAIYDSAVLSPGEIRAIVSEEAAKVQLVSGRPSDMFYAGARSWGMRSIVPRRNDRSYKVRTGHTTLETLRLVIDRDPDASKAMSNFLLLMGQGYEKIVSEGADKDGKPIPSPAGDKFLTEFDARVGEEYGTGMDAVINVLNKTLIWQGAEAGELGLTDDLREVADVYPVSPDRVTFKRDERTKRLRRGTFTQDSTIPGRDPDGFIEFPARQFRYIPLHPNVDEPYGTPPLLAALTAIFFKVELLEDLKAVVHNQGHARLDISVTLQSIMDNVPNRLREKGNAGELRAFVSGFLADISTAFASLNPDDSFIHPDNIVSTFIGPTGSVDFKSLSEIIDNQIIAGVKQLPVMLGRNEGATTTHATIQWQIQTLEIAAFQRITKRMVEWFHNSAMAIAGIPATSIVTFAALRTAERLAEAQAFGQEITNAAALEDRGYIDQDEAAVMTIGHKATGTKATPFPAAAPAAANGATNAGTDTTGTNSATRKADEHGDHNSGKHAGPLTGGVKASGNGPTLEPGSSALALNGSGLGSGTGSVRGSADERRRRDQQSTTEDQQVRDHHDPGTKGDHHLERTKLVRLHTEIASTPQPSLAVSVVYAIRLADAQADLDDLTASIQPEIVARFSALADMFPSEAIASGDITPSEWFATDAGLTWSGTFRTILTDHYKAVYNVKGGEVLAELGIEGVFDLQNPEALAALEQFGLDRVTGMDDTTKSTVLDILRAGIDNGDHPFDIAASIRASINGMTGSRAETIARTETAHAYSYAALDSYKRNGVKFKRWLTAEDDKVDPPCPSYSDEGAIDIDSQFGGAHDHPPAHPHCRCALIADLTDAADQEPWMGE